MAPYGMEFSTKPVNPSLVPPDSHGIRLEPFFYFFRLSFDLYIQHTDTHTWRPLVGSQLLCNSDPKNPRKNCIN